MLLQILFRNWLLAKGARVVGSQPIGDALSVEEMPSIAGQFYNLIHFFVFFHADYALDALRVLFRIESLLLHLAKKVPRSRNPISVNSVTSPDTPIEGWAEADEQGSETTALKQSVVS